MVEWRNNGGGVVERAREGARAKGREKAHRVEIAGCALIFEAAVWAHSQAASSVRVLADGDKPG